MMKIKEIDINSIVTNPLQPRKSFDDAGILELAKSIKANGLIQPIVVRPSGNGYMVIAGERRYRAFKLLSETKIAAIIVEAGDNESENLSLIENIQRLDLNPLEEALAYQSLLANQKITQEQLAGKIGKSQSAIANKLRLLQLSPDVKAAINDRLITERHGRSMLGLSEESQVKVLKKVLSGGLTVTQTEKVIEKEKQPKVIVRKALVSRNATVQLAINTVNETYQQMKSAGIPVVKEENETDEFYEISLKIRKRD